MKVEIKNRWTGEVIYSCEAPEGTQLPLRYAVEAAVKAGANLTEASLTRANLTGANLTGASLTGADLAGADLARANLAGANLAGAYLIGAYLTGAYLAGASLAGAYLTGANLTGAYLARASLAGAYLTGASLTGANLTGASLARANLAGADLAGASLTGASLTGAKNVEARLLLKKQIVPQVGTFTGFKKLAGNVICKLEVPAEAKRVGGVIGRKCRVEFAKVLEGEGVSIHDSTFAYKAGEIVRPRCDFDPNPLVECAAGIHLFLSREEAEDFEM